MIFNMTKTLTLILAFIIANTLALAWTFTFILSSKGTLPRATLREAFSRVLSQGPFQGTFLKGPFLKEPF